MDSFQPLNVPPASPDLLEGFVGDPDFMLSLARGMLVLRSFAEKRRKLTAAEVTATTGLPRSTVRRCLYTLTALGYLANQGNLFWPRVSVMMLAAGFSGASGLETLQPILDGLRDRLGITVGFASFDGENTFSTIVARSFESLSLASMPGRRLSAYSTATGRVFLADLTDAELDVYFDKLEPVPNSDLSTTDKTVLRRLVNQARVDGYAIAQNEVSPGVCTVAVPIRPVGKRVEAVIFAGGETSRLPDDVVHASFLPELKRAATEIGLYWDRLG